MALSTAMFTSLTGLNASSQMLNVTGNNISNVNTAAFKRSRITFQTQISRNLASGSAPTEDTGGTNPAQVGQGVSVGSIRRDFNNGPIQPTGVNTDLAIEGNGFFIVDVNGSRNFTRDGGFTLDRDYRLVHPGTGGVVQGYAADSEFNIVDGVLGPIEIPLGITTLAEETTEVKFKGNLNAGGDIGTQGAIITTGAMSSGSNAGPAATSTTALTDLYATGGAATSLFSTGDLITVSGVERGGATITDATFEVGTSNTTGATDFGSTVQDFMDFMTGILGLDTAQGASVAVGSGGELIITGNRGEANNLVMSDGSIIVNQTSSPETPFDFTKTQDANGESVRTTYVVYDSLGNPVTVDMTVVLENKDNTGTSWRFYLNSDDDTDLTRSLGSGVAEFDNEGRFIAMTDGQFNIDRQNVGSITPMQVAMDFSDPYGAVSALTETRSQISAVSQDGSPIGTLEDFSVSADGTIVGTFSNGLLRNLGRIPVAMFANNEGLEEMGGNMFRPTPNSGIPVIVSPTTGGAGRMMGRALELSNVDLAEEFINMISASTGFSASSRVLSTSDQMIQELLATVR